MGDHTLPVPALDSEDQPIMRFPRGYTARQGVNVCEFTPPPLDGSLFPAEFIDWHLKWSDLHPYTMIIGDDRGNSELMTWGEVGRAVHRLAKYISDAVPTGPADDHGKPKTVAIISAAEPITYNTVILACLRAGFEPFPLSPRNSPAGLKHLMKSMHVHYVIGSIGDSQQTPLALQQNIATVLDELISEEHAVNLIEEPHYWELYPRLAHWPYPPYDRKADVDATSLMAPLRDLDSYRNADLATWPAMTMHSSGSTRFPKPIRADQRMLRHWMDLLWYGDSDVCGTVFAAHGLPSFHVGGLLLYLGCPITCGAIVANFKPSEPALAMTPQTSLQGLRKADVDWLLAIPMFLELWSHDPHAVEFLATRRAVMFGSAPLSFESGERLTKLGVNLVNVYGCTETAVVSKVTMERGRREWLYTEIAPCFVYRLDPDDDSEQKTYRVVFEEADDYCPLEFNIPGQRAYDTHDIVSLHPTIKGHIRILGRSDDQIIHSSGEKTNPGPLENIMLGSSLVKSAVYFGRERAQAGVIVEPMNPVNVDDIAATAAYRNSIWSHIERANKHAPAYSRVFKEYVLVADITKKPLARTPKGSIARGVILRDYEAEINKLYADIEQYNGSDWAQPPTDWTEDSICQFIARVVQGAMRSEAEDKVVGDRDLFLQGCDSLQATLIRNSIIHALRKRLDIGENAASSKSEKRDSLLAAVPQDLVYVHPSVTGLSAFVVSLVNSGSKPSGAAGTSPSEHIPQMLSLVEKYGSNFPSRASAPQTLPSMPHDGESVLLTGSTGSLGSYILAALVERPQIKKIYALNRPNTAVRHIERQDASLVDRGLRIHLAEHEKVVLLDGVTSEPKLGLPDSQYEELRTNLTSVIHAAWPLNFSMQVTSFEPHIAGSRNLLDLALTSAKEVQFLFASSIGSVGNWKAPEPVPERLLDASTAVGTGYGEGKWVVDQILARASHTCCLSTTSLRIGQLSGSTLNGAWNATDWIPRIVQTGYMTGKLPLVDDADTVSWLPVDTAATAVVEVLLQPAQGSRVLSLAHPTPSCWNDIMKQVGDYLSGLGQPIHYLPYERWVDELESLSTAPSALSTYSALVLLQWLRALKNGQGRNGREALGLPKMATSEMRKVSSVLGEAPVLSGKDVERWMRYWAGHGMFETHGR